MTVDIDAAWLAGKPTYPNGPYFLDTSYEDYVLQTDVTTLDTTFIVAGMGISLDLNGHIVTYSNRTQVVIPNGDFETTDFTGWDLTHAPSFSRVTASEFAHGSWMYQGTTAVEEYIVTPAFTPPVYPYEYCAWSKQKATGSSAWTATIRIDVLRASDSLVLATVTRGNLDRGFAVKVQHKISTGDALKLKFTFIPTVSTTFWIDWIQYLYSRNYGIYCGQENYERSAYGDYEFIEGAPAQLWAVPGFSTRTYPYNFTLTDSTHTHSPLAPGTGLITSGIGAAREGYSLKSKFDTNLIAIDGVRMKVTGIDGGNVYNAGLAAGNTRQEITNCYLECDVPSISNRMYGGINVLKSRGSLLLTDSDLVNNPRLGVLIGDCSGVVKSEILRNNIVQKGIVPQHYGICLAQVSNLDILSNTITTVPGYSARGILVDDSGSGYSGDIKDIRIFDNDISVEAVANIENGISETCTGIRIRIYGNRGLFRNVEIDNNTIHAETGTTNSVCSAYGIRIYLMNPSGYADNCNLRIHDNDIIGLCSCAPGTGRYHSIGLAIDHCEEGAWPIFYSNNIESNYTCFSLGSYGDGYSSTIRDLISCSNTHIKSALYPDLYTFRSIGFGWDTTGYGSGTTRPEAGCFILDPQYSGGAPEYWTWVDTSWSVGMTGEAISGWKLTVLGDVASAPISVVDILSTIRFSGTADASGDLDYIPGPTATHVHTKGQAPTFDIDTTLTPITVNYGTQNRVITPIANTIVDFSVVEAIKYVFVVN